MSAALTSVHSVRSDTLLASVLREVCFDRNQPRRCCGNKGFAATHEACEKDGPENYERIMMNGVVLEKSSGE